MDMTTAFLDGTINEEIYVKKPPRCEVKDYEMVCKLQKSLYGLKQAPLVWNKTLSNMLTDNGLSNIISEQRLFIKDTIYIGVYVDGLVLDL